MTPIVNVVRTTKERLYGVFDDREINCATVCRGIGRSTSYISEQLRKLGGVAAPVAVFLETQYGIKREEYEIKPTPKMDLCPSCYYSMLHTGFVRKTSWLDHELTCDNCHRHSYGGTYEVLRREGTV